MIEQYRGRRMSGLLRMVMVAVMAMVFGVAGYVPCSQAAGDIDPNGTYIEAENHNANVNIGTTHQLAIVADGAANGGFAVENTSGNTNNTPVGDRLEFSVNFPTGGIYYFWLRLRNSGTGDSAFFGLDGNMVGAFTQITDGAYYWTNNVQTGTFSATITAGAHTINIWGRENVFIDGIYLTTSATIPPGFGGAPGEYTGTIPTGAKVLDPTAPVDSTPPAAGTVTVAPQSGSFVPAAFTISTIFTDAESAVTSCQYTLNNGGAWAAGTVSGTGPYTCTANVTGQSNGASLTINMRATSTGGTGTATAINRTVDATAPTDGTLSATPGNSQVVLDWTAAADAGSGLRGTNTYKLVRGNAGAGAPANCSSGTQVYLGTALTATATGLANGSSYGFRVCAYDALDNLSTGSTASATPTACVEGEAVALDAIPDPIVAATSISATASAGATNIKVGTVAAPTNNSPWTYTPPVNATGSVTFYATATGDCGTISATPVNVTYDTRTGTAAGTATAVGADESIKVSAPYTGDANGNNSVKIEWGFNGVDFTLGTVTLPHAATPYAYTITNLTNGTAYQVRVTYQDDTIIGGTAVQTILNAIPLNNLVHNSRVTGSAKWPTAQSGEAVAGWGIAGSKYGKFTCATCHMRASSNIMRIKQTITAPDAIPSDFPGSAQTVLFTTTDQVAHPSGSGFGDDNPPTGRTSSNKVCEVCHSITSYHRYNTNVDPDGAGPLTAQTNLGHYNNQDCLGCHQHNQGFKASCDSCHGSPPVDAATLVKATSRPTGSTTAGAHTAHSTTLGIDCAQCHYGSVGSGARHNVDGAVTLGFVDLPSGTGGSDAGSYTGQNVGGGKVVYNSNDAGTTVKNSGDVGFGTRTCANYCHGSTIVDGSTKSPVWDGGSPIACGTCHRGSNADMDNASALGSHRTHAGATRENLACTACHGAAAGNLKIAGSDATNHVDGTATWDVSGLSKHYSSASNPDYKTSPTGSTGALAPTAPASYGTCRNLACHWGTETPKWGVGPATCTTCHRGAGGDTGLLKDSAPVSGSHADHAYASDTYVDCDDCHGAGAITGTHAGHLDNATNFAGRLTPGTNFTDNGGRANTNDTCAVICHKNATWGASSDAGSITWTLETTACDGVAVGAPVVNYCLDCHASTYTGQAGPAVVTSAFVGSHLNAKSPDETMSCLAERRNQCLECHVMHDGTQSTSAVWIPIPGTAGEQAVLGLDYTGAKHFNAINLKKTIPSSGAGAVTAGTEAQICWGCHDSTRNSGTVQSEWGVNNNTSTGSITYDYGDLYTTLGGSTKTSNWTTGYWSSGNGRLSSDIFWYKRGAVQSTHAVDPNATRPGLDAVANIRCSYCHDVHDLNKASGDAVTGQPYLRGTWKGNPYREDGAPHSSTTYPDLSPYGRVPRGERANTELGGYQIDQNNANPTATWTLANSAGLCTLCHGSNVNTMNKFDTNEAGVAETTAQSWVGTNGHSAAVLGGTNTVAANIFTNSNRGSTDRTGADPDVTNGPMAYQGGTGGSGPGDTDRTPTTRGTRMGSAGSDVGSPGLQPYVFNHTSEFNRRAGYDWGATIDNATTQNDYHSFSCSKCHNPHASRLPRLMITNCLDTSHNTWDDDNGNPSTISGSNAGTQLSDATTSQNCHRRATQGGDGSGWNNVTPW